MTHRNDRYDVTVKGFPAHGITVRTKGTLLAGLDIRDNHRSGIYFSPYSGGSVLDSLRPVNSHRYGALSHRHFELEDSDGLPRPSSNGVRGILPASSRLWVASYIIDADVRNFNDVTGPMKNARCRNSNGT